MRTGLKLFGIVALVLLVLAAVLFGAWSWFGRRALPQTAGQIEVAGLSQPAEVVRDAYGVAHIYAQSPADLFFAQGFSHAQERFWQMEFQRRVGAGRLSELFGENTLETDRYLRSFGFYHLAEETTELVNAETRQVLEAYAAGVNAYIAGRSPAELGLEFGLLGLQGVEVEVEPWRPADSLVWGQMLIFNQSDQISSELANVALLAAVGQERYEELRPAYRNDRPVIVASEELEGAGRAEAAAPAGLGPAEIAYLQSFAAASAGEASPAGRLALGLGQAGGSNSFVVAGERTATGMPLLANDPHMGINMPSLWYEIGLHCAPKSETCVYDLRGFSLPGVPGILIGHNDRIAWGLTNAAFDAEDLFVERINLENPDQYEVNGEWVDMEIRREEIVVRGREEPVVLLVRATRNGLIVSDGMVDAEPFAAGPAGPELYELAYAWTALEPAGSVQAVMGVLRAQDWDDFVAALAGFDAGKQNWLYADVAGNIGYLLPGKIPIRAGGDGSLPVPGWNDDHIWTGFIPYAELPRVYNPAAGYIVTANNPQVRADEYPYLLGRWHDRGQRAERISELITADPDGVSLEDMIAAQTDNLSLSALEIAPYLEGLSFDDEAAAAGRDRLLAWDGQMTLGSPEAALFNLFWVELLAAIFDDAGLPADSAARGGGLSADIVYALLQQPASAWWDSAASPDRVEARDNILEPAFERAYAAGVERFGDDLDDWRWGDLHTVFFEHATLGQSGIGPIESLFNRGPFAVHGSESVPQKSCWNALEPFAATCAPALRQVIDLGELANSRLIYSGGQSGHPLSPHYDDFIAPWRELEYHPSNWERSQAIAGEFELLVLQPE